MAERRTDTDTMLLTEYALFLADLRGTQQGLAFFDSRRLPHAILLRALPLDARRRHDRRCGQRPA